MMASMPPAAPPLSEADQNDPNARSIGALFCLGGAAVMMMALRLPARIVKASTRTGAL